MKMGTRLSILQIPRTEGRSRQGAATETDTQSKTAICEMKHSKFEYSQG